MRTSSYTFASNADMVPWTIFATSSRVWFEYFASPTLSSFLFPVDFELVSESRSTFPEVAYRKKAVWEHLYEQICFDFSHSKRVNFYIIYSLSISDTPYAITSTYLYHTNVTNSDSTNFWSVKSFLEANRLPLASWADKLF